MKNRLNTDKLYEKCRYKATEYFSNDIIIQYVQMDSQKFIRLSEVKEWLGKAAPEALTKRGKVCVFLGDPDLYSRTSAKLSVRGVEVKESIHRVVLLWKLKSLQFPEGCEASHLCGKKGCVNRDHLVAETHDINVSRKVCHKRSRKSCSHDPKCIKKSR